MSAAPVLVVVTGPPGAGKTTLAGSLADELRLPLVTKDDLKDALFDALGIGDRDWSRAVGLASMNVLFLQLERLLGAGVPTIAESNFWRSHETPRFRELPSHRCFQIHLSASEDVLVARYVARRKHPGHLGAEVAHEIGPALVAREWDPLDLPGELVQLDTSSFPLELGDLVERLQALLGR